MTPSHTTPPNEKKPHHPDGKKGWVTPLCVRRLRGVALRLPAGYLNATAIGIELAILASGALTLAGFTARVTVGGGLAWGIALLAATLLDWIDGPTSRNPPWSG